MSLLNEDTHICIVGCGLIGGSFALALRRAGFKGYLTAFDAEPQVRLAIERGVVDSREVSFDEDRNCDADLIFLSAPIGGIIDFLRRRSDRIKAGSIVTDAGSTKAEICRVARESLPAGVHFIGGHPMAGSEHSGVEYARADLFDRATWAIIAPDPSPKLNSLVELVETLGARSLLMSPDEHDRAVGLVSHLPQILASTLATLLVEPTPGTSPEATSSDIDLARKMAAGGWRDMTRLAGSSFAIWRDILMTNHQNLNESLGLLLIHLQHLQDALERKDYAAVRDLFDEANRSVTLLRDVYYRRFDKVQ